jgi:hypothetical protein
MTASVFRIVLEIGDSDRAMEFYARLLGAEGRKVGGGRVYFDCGSVTLALLQPEEKNRRPLRSTSISRSTIWRRSMRAPGISALSRKRRYTARAPQRSWFVLGASVPSMRSIPGETGCASWTKTPSSPAATRADKYARKSLHVALWFCYSVRPVTPRDGREWIALSALVLSLTSGCSWLFVQPLPESYDRRDYPVCTSSRTGPVLDTLFALTNTASAIYVAGENNVTNKNAAVTLGLGVAALWTASAVYGYSHTSECDAAKEDRGRGYYAPPAGLRARPQYYPQPPPVQGAVPAPPIDGTAPAPAGASTPAPAGSQQQDNDDPRDRPAEDLPSPRPPRKVPERLDAPRFGN